VGEKRKRKGVRKEEEKADVGRGKEGEERTNKENKLQDKRKRRRR
jgi:hypothetical protein